MGEKGRKREGEKWKKRRLIGVAAVGAILVTTFASQAVCASVPLFNESILRGYVFDTQGNPIQRALIEWRDSETMELFELTTTTYTGYYSTPHLFNDAGAVRSLITAAKTDFSTNSTIITTEPAFPPTFYELNFTLLEIAETGSININEIMYNPSTEQGSDTVLEWIELRNDDTAAVNLNGWTIATPEVGKITEDLVVQPGGYAVLARNKDAFENYYGSLPCTVVEVEMSLGNAEDTVVLKDGAGTEIDRVSYKDDWGADGNGKTLERNATGWFESEVEGGTPCERNSIIHEKPDLVIDEVKINPGGTRGEEIVRVYVNESNNLTAVVQNNGNADAGAFEVCFEVGSGVEVGCVNVAGLPAGANATVSTFWTPCCENYSVEPGFPARSLPTTVNVTADCTEKIPESDEANNLLSKFIPAVQQYAGYDVLGGVVNNGYKSKNFDCNATEEPLTLFEHDETLLGGGVALNVSGAKISSFDPGETSTRTHHIEIPEGATVKTARLYVYWYDKWGNYKQYPTGCLAKLSVNFGGTEFAPAKKYNDQKGFGYYHSPKGTYTYNVTSKVREAGSGDYTAVVKNTDPKNSTTLLGEMLLVVYDDPAKTNLTQIWVLEGNDYLMSADETHNSYNYGVSPEEATATVKLPGNLTTAAANLSSVCSATLISVVAQGMSPGANLLFNGEVVKTDAWNTETEAYPNSKINLESLDVKPYLTLTASGNRGNSVGFQDTGTDGMQASNAILVVEYSEQEPLHPAVSISTDKTDYAPGETMQITLNLSNPTGTDQTVWFEWYFGIPVYSYWLPFVEPLPLNLPAGCEYSFPFSILVGNWGETGFDAVWLVNLSDPVTHEIISSDTAEWSYAPVPPATALATAAVSSEQTRSVENFDEEMLGSGREIEKKLKAKLESETEKR